VVIFETMSLHEFRSWLEISIQEYAQDKARSGNVAAEKALEESTREFNELLPKGLDTEGNYIYNVVDEDSRQIVGTLWFKIRHDQQDVFIYEIRIDEDHRGKGFGKQTMQALEVFIKDKGFPRKVSLHVFGDNDVAIQLYRSAGYVATNIRMSKIIMD